MILDLLYYVYAAFGILTGIVIPSLVMLIPVVSLIEKTSSALAGIPRSHFTRVVERETEIL